MTETIESTTARPGIVARRPPKKRGGGLNSMLIADLKSMAGGMGIAGAGSMKKAQLVEAIKAAQSGASRAPSRVDAADGGPHDDRAARPAARSSTTRARAGRASRRSDRAASARDDQPRRTARSRQPRTSGSDRRQRPGDRDQDTATRQPGPGQPDQTGRDQRQTSTSRTSEPGPDSRTRAASNRASQTGNQDRGDQRNRDRAARSSQDQQQPGPAAEPGPQGDERGRRGSRRNRRRRGRDRDRNGGRRPAATGDRSGARQRNEPDTTILEDDVLVPAAGILDVLDNYAFVRTSGYLPGTDDVYVSLSMVRKYGLRRGDAIVGQVRQPREGERKEKFNPMVRIDTVNGADPEAAKNRVEFAKLTPLYPDRAAAPRDRADQPDRPGHRHRRPDRQGPARPDRVARPRPARR